MTDTINGYYITLTRGVNGTTASCTLRDSAGERYFHKLYQGYDDADIFEDFATECDWQASF